MNVTLSADTAPPPASEYSLSVCVLASGSKGNAVYISNGETAILLDAGLSGIEIERSLKSRGLSPQKNRPHQSSPMNTMIIFRGARRPSRALGLPVYRTLKTAGGPYR
jgi:hypothetical protein